jgi:hypothetical protein
VPTDSLTELAKVIAQGSLARRTVCARSSTPSSATASGKRYHAPTATRDAYALADGDEGVPYAGIINPDDRPLVRTEERLFSGSPAVKPAR